MIIKLIFRQSNVIWIGLFISSDTGDDLFCYNLNACMNLNGTKQLTQKTGQEEF